MTVRSADTPPSTARTVATTFREGPVGMRDAPAGAEFNPPNCQGTTKAGTMCSAKRAHKTMFCIGHLRQNGDV